MAGYNVVTHDLYEQLREQATEEQRSRVFGNDNNNKE